MRPDADRLIDSERLVAPREDGGLLFEPAPGRWRWLSTSPSSHAEVRLGGKSIRDLRRAWRERVGLCGPVIVAGHQPEFFHAGVLAKNLAAAALAARLGGTAVFLAVDTDVPKTAHLRVPQVTAGGLRRLDLPIPGAEVQRSYADQPRATSDRWLGLFAQAGAALAAHGETLLPTFARAWLAGAPPQVGYVDAFGRARQASERAAGIEPLVELRVSELASGPEFGAFVAALLADAPRFGHEYNAALETYRRHHRVSAPGRPVPPLASLGDRVEVPLWISRRGHPRRRMFVRPSATGVDVFCEDEPAFSIDVAAEGSGAAWPPPEPWRVWPRALTLSAFVRLLLADLFIHGIGGARYDEMTERFASRFFTAELAPITCVSATLRLPLPRARVGVEDWLAARHAARDVRHNPQRHLAQAPAELLAARAEWVRRSEELRRAPRSRAVRVERAAIFSEIRRVNARLLEVDPWLAARYDQRVETIAASLAQDRIALDREYFYGLHRVADVRRLSALIHEQLEARPAGSARSEAS